MATGIGILILLIFAALALRHLQRTFFYPPPGTMPEAVDDDIVATLRRFEAVLAEHAPTVLASLQPGLSDEELRRMEARYRLRLSAEMRALYRFFPSLATFLTGAAECYETGIYHGGQRGRVHEDYDRSFALWARYAASPRS